MKKILMLSFVLLTLTTTSQTTVNAKATMEYNLTQGLNGNVHLGLQSGKLSFYTFLNSNASKFGVEGIYNFVNQEYYCFGIHERIYYSQQRGYVDWPSIYQEFRMNESTYWNLLLGPEINSFFKIQLGLTKKF